jgi:putative DNA primase/helicase
VTADEKGYAYTKTMAQYYATTFGWKIMPTEGLGPDGRCTCGRIHSEPKDIAKHPWLSSWQIDATSDVAVIADWWDTHPMSNVGVMAKRSGFFVVDVDPRSGGYESLDTFESRFPDALTPTVEAITGVYTYKGKTLRGKHLFYKADENEQLLINLKSMGLDGIDVKHNGYAMLAPSNHGSGVSYEWAPGHAPWEIEMATANDELLGALRKNKRSVSGTGGGGSWDFVDDLSWGQNKLDLQRFLDDGIDEGSRAVDIYAMACAIANQAPKLDDYNRKNIETMMIRFNYEMVRPPLEVDGAGGLLTHVHNAIDFVANNPKTAVTGQIGKYASEWAEKRKNGPVQEYSEPEPATSHPTDFDTFDPDDYESEWVDTGLAGTVGGQVKQMAFSGGAIRGLDVPDDPDALTAEEGGDPDHRSLSDLGNGRRFVDTFGTVVRYTPGLGWFNWVSNNRGSGYWKPDIENLGTREYAKRLPSLIAREVLHYEDNKEQGEVIKWSDQTKANSRQNNALESGQSDPRIAVEVEEWDSQPTLFGCLNGVIDLKTGELLKGRPDLYITRRAPVAYTTGTIDPRWQKFLDYATGGDVEYQEWLQKAAGYTLTGLRTHDVMFLMYGPGGTGKNVFTEALVKVMGTKDYAWPMDSQILAQGDGQAHGSDLYHWAELRGRRMVWVDELPESERLKENSVKKLTGSSEISARSPGEKPFTFQSRAKLWVTTNHRPIITDDAMWRRIRPIPWVNIPEKPDPGLKDYIFDPNGGLPGVLAWAVQGAMKILNSTESDTLGWCKVVSDAAEVYRKNEDRLGRFLEEEIVATPGKNLPVSIIFSAYEGWSQRRNEKPMSTIAFERKLMDRRLPIEGEGKRAHLKDFDLAPAEPLQNSAHMDWDMLSRMNNF